MTSTTPQPFTLADMQRELDATERLKVHARGALYDDGWRVMLIPAAVMLTLTQTVPARVHLSLMKGTAMELSEAYATASRAMAYWRAHLTQNDSDNPWASSFKFHP